MPPQALAPQNTRYQHVVHIQLTEPVASVYVQPQSGSGAERMSKLSGRYMYPIRV